MKKYVNSKLHSFLFLLLAQCLLISCGPSVRLTASWRNGNSGTIKFSKILVVAIGQDLQKRRLEEDQVMRKLWANSIPAMTSLDAFGPDFATQPDSTKMKAALLSKQFDGILTISMLNGQERDRWMPRNGDYVPAHFYHSFYNYCYSIREAYSDPEYMIINLETFFESNLYSVSTGTLLWSGQTKTFTRDPTQAIVVSYVHHMVKEMLRSGVLL